MTLYNFLVAYYVLFVVFADFMFWVVTLLAVAFLCGVIPVAFYTLMERRIMAAVQRRVGPNVVGFWGVLQPVADGVKLMAKEHVMPREAAKVLYLASPAISMSISYVSWFYVPLGTFSDFETDFGLFILFAISALASYGVILAGWSSHSRYAVMGALRAIAQLISYEVVLLLFVFPIVVFTGSYRLADLVESQGDGAWFFVTCLPAALIFYVILLAETNRTPFDLPEAEAELVSGFNIEYSSMLFAMFSLAEYNSMLVMSAIFAIFFLGGWSDILFISRLVLVAVSFVLVRALLPRYRYDQLMATCWRMFLPFGLGYLLFACALTYALIAVSPDAGFIYSEVLAFVEMLSHVLSSPQSPLQYWRGIASTIVSAEDLACFIYECPTELLRDISFPSNIALVNAEEREAGIGGLAVWNEIWDFQKRWNIASDELSPQVPGVKGFLNSLFNQTINLSIGASRVIAAGTQFLVNEVATYALSYVPDAPTLQTHDPLNTPTPTDEPVDDEELEEAADDKAKKVASYGQAQRAVKKAISDLPAVEPDDVIEIELPNWLDTIKGWIVKIWNFIAWMR